MKRESMPEETLLQSSISGPPRKMKIYLIEINAITGQWSEI